MVHSASSLPRTATSTDWKSEMPAFSAPTQTKSTTSTVASGTQQGGQAAAPAAVVPFTRASKPRSRQQGANAYTLTANQQVVAPIQIAAAGFIRYLELDIQVTAAGNSA